MKNKASEAEKQQAAITEAVEKAKAEIGAPSDPVASQELSKRHAEELRAQETKLKAQYDADVKARIDAAVAEALKSRPEAPAAAANPDQQAAIDAAIAEHEKKIQARHAEEIHSAVERGRLEQAAKGKLKDSQLVKAQKRVKDLEAQIQEWKAAGIALPPPSTPAAAPTAAATTASTSAPPTTPVTARPPVPTGQTVAAARPVAQAAAGPSQPKPSPVTAATNAAAGGNAAALPRRPPVGGATTGGVPLGRGGAVRGLPRGGVPGGRGGAPVRTAPVKQPAPAAAAAATTTATVPAGGVSIMGAAGKRPREEGTSPADDSLAKRLKPADAAGKPLPIRRPPGADS